MTQEELNQIDRPATSLFVERGQTFEVVAILENLQQYFLLFLHDFMQQGFSPFFPFLQTRSAFKKGQKVQFCDNQTCQDVIFETWNPDGSVELRLANGKLKIFHAGEFIF